MRVVSFLVTACTVQWQSPDTRPVADAGASVELPTVSVKYDVESLAPPPFGANGSDVGTAELRAARKVLAVARALEARIAAAE